jgi:hypothetical protein
MRRLSLEETAFGMKAGREYFLHIKNGAVCFRSVFQEYIIEHDILRVKFMNSGVRMHTWNIYDILSDQYAHWFIMDGYYFTTEE